MGRQSYGSPLERLGLTFQLSDGPSWNSRPAAWLRPKSLVRVAGEVVSTDVRVWTHSVGNTGVVLHGCRCYIRACSGGFGGGNIANVTPLLVLSLFFLAAVHVYDCI